MLDSGEASLIIVGRRKKPPFSDSASGPPVAMSCPADLASSRVFTSFLNCSSFCTGPILDISLVASLVVSTNASTNASKMSAWMYSLRGAMQTCPALNHSPPEICGTVAVTLISGRIMAGLFPALALRISHCNKETSSYTYVSRVILFIVSAPSLRICFPVAVDPVKEIFWIPGCLTRAGPRSFPPLRTWITDGGKTSWASSTSFRDVYGVNGLRVPLVDPS